MKLFLLITAFFLVLQADKGYAQSSQYTNSGKVYTIDEANRLNGTAQPTINGKPYSQYKAEQEALKRQQDVQLNKNGQRNATLEPIKGLQVVSGSSAPAPITTSASRPAKVNEAEAKGTSLEQVAKSSERPVADPSGSVIEVKAEKAQDKPVKIEGSIASDAPKAAVTEPAKAVSATPVAPQEPAKADAPSPKVKAAPGQGN